MQPSPKNVIALSDSLLAEAKETRSSGTRMLYYAVLLREWLYSVKPGTNLRRATMRTEDILLLAREHFELWQRLGVFAENHHLLRSKALFQEYLNLHPHYDEANDLITYFKVLQHLGEKLEASNVIQRVLSKSESHPDYANFLFYAGVIFKSLDLYDNANTYFFESQQVGPPKFFSKLEMMVILSRIIEEKEGEENGNEDSYRMVRSL
jgi:tetratricopeptide (TPR) repeat protein